MVSTLSRELWPATMLISLAGTFSVLASSFIVASFAAPLTGTAVTLTDNCRPVHPQTWSRDALVVTRTCNFTDGMAIVFGTAIVLVP
jgi:hypothetical protein